MKNMDDLIEDAVELADRGLSKGEIADELNVSRETASWLVKRGGSPRQAPETTPTENGPHDIHVDWSTIGRDSTRLTHIGNALADVLSKQGQEIDLTVGIEKAGMPLATTVAQEIETDLAAYAPSKHQWEEGDIEELGGSFSRNFAEIRHRECYIVDDTITSGTTLRETIQAVRDEGGQPVAAAVVVDKQGLESIDDVPVYSLVNVVSVSEQS